MVSPEPAPSAPQAPQALPACPFCGRVAPTVHVHGHVQCTACGVNVDPCCGGARSGDR